MAPRHCAKRPTALPKNLGDKVYRLAGYNFAAARDANGNITAPGLGGEDTIVGYYGDPRTISLSVGYRF